ncbi:ECF-type sigma factor [Ferrimonas pelagia]|uniref:RNA polymerase sigma-70 ECF-like HTH domain-containing protein n=1 Tax=Ferrimonas pelagia TaxID=1177826 RepID=A0ABP9EKN4_9GAMM
MVERENVSEGESKGALSTPQMVAMLYQQLRQRARGVKSRMPHCATLDSRALIHEVYAKMAGKEQVYTDEQHFLAAASRAMRHVLIDYLRQKQAGKRDQDGLDIEAMFPESRLDQMVEIDAALRQFESRFPREHDVAVFRIFGGLTVDECAEALSISAATVKRDWTFAQAWLHKHISRD